MADVAYGMGPGLRITILKTAAHQIGRYILGFA